MISIKNNKFCSPESGIDNDAVLEKAERRE